MNNPPKTENSGGVIITRRPGETIVINKGEVVIQIRDVKSNRVKIAIKAAKEIEIRRGELVEALKKL